MKCGFRRRATSVATSRNLELCRTRTASGLWRVGRPKARFPAAMAWERVWFHLVRGAEYTLACKSVSSDAGELALVDTTATSWPISPSARTKERIWIAPPLLAAKSIPSVQRYKTFIDRLSPEKAPSTQTRRSPTRTALRFWLGRRGPTARIIPAGQEAGPKLRQAPRAHSAEQEDRRALSPRAPECQTPSSRQQGRRSPLIPAER